jgi:predicted small metal-binding protein
MVPMSWICLECNYPINADQVDEMIAKINFHNTNNDH